MKRWGIVIDEPYYNGAMQAEPATLILYWGQRAWGWTLHFWTKIKGAEMKRWQKVLHVMLGIGIGLVVGWGLIQLMRVVGAL